MLSNLYVIPLYLILSPDVLQSLLQGPVKSEMSELHVGRAGEVNAGWGTVALHGVGSNPQTLALGVRKSS